MNKIPKRQTIEQAQANLDALFQIGAPTEPKTQQQKAEELQEPGSRSSSFRIIPPENGDVLTELPEKLLVDFPREKHPFRAYTPQEMDALKEDIIPNGILQPLIVRPHPTMPGHYEIIAGHNRRAAAKDVGYTTLPCIVRNLDDDTALLQMISTNLKQRTHLLPSEKAWAYRYQMEAIKRQGQRTDLTSPQVAAKLRSDDKIGSHEGVSGDTIRRYIRLTYLTPALLKKVDESKLPLTVGETVSYISTTGQQIVENFFFLQRTLTITQATADKLREMDEAGTLSEQELEVVFLSPVVVKQMKAVSIKMKKWRKYFDADATEQQVVETIEKALKAYFEREET